MNNNKLPYGIKVTKTPGNNPPVARKVSSNIPVANNTQLPPSNDVPFAKVPIEQTGLKNPNKPKESNEPNINLSKLKHYNEPSKSVEIPIPKGDNINKARLRLEQERCRDIGSPENLPFGLLHYMLKHIWRSMKELVYEVILLVVNDGSDAPSTIPFVWERVGMNFRKKTSNTSAVAYLNKKKDVIDNDTIISIIKKIHLKETIDEIIEKFDYTDKSIIHALDKRAAQINKRDELIKDKTLTFEVKEEDINNDKSIIDNLKRFKFSADVKDSNSESKTNVNAGKYILQFIKYYFKNFVLTCLMLYFVIHLILGSAGKMTSTNPETRAKGLSKLIFGIVIIYFVYTWIRTESLQPIFTAIGLCFIWGIVSLIFYYGFQFYKIYSCQCDPEKLGVNVYKCRPKDFGIPYTKLTITDILLLFVSFSLFIFSTRQVGRLFDYEQHKQFLSRLESVRIREWLENDWIIFKVLVVLYLTLMIRGLLEDKIERNDPMLTISYVFFFLAVFIAYIQYLLGNRYLEHKTSVRNLKDIGTFAHKIDDISQGEKTTIPEKE